MDFQTIGDFIRRTVENLRFIQDKHANGNGWEKEVFEVTQLLNSLVLPLELLVNKEYVLKDALKNTPPSGRKVSSLKNLLEQIDKKVSKVQLPYIKPHEGSKQPTALAELAENIRNSAAHFNMRFLVTGAEKKRKIVGVVLWSVHPRTDVKWKGEITVPELRRFVTDLLTQVADGPLGAIPITSMCE